MTFHPFVVLFALLPTCASAADFVGMLNQTEQDYKIERKRLDPPGPTLAAGTEPKFTCIGLQTRPLPRGR